jgi:hypothetical protein
LKDLQQAVSGHLANISGLESLLTEANNEALARDKELYAASAPIASADRDLGQARFALLVTQYAKAITPAISLARELRSLAPSLGIALGESGLLLEFSRPKIGPYSVANDGSLSLHIIGGI